MAVKDQKITDRYAIYNGDCCEGLRDVPDESVGFSVFSPPFADLYSYSDDLADMSNCRGYDEFFKQFGYLVDHLLRVMMPGRVVAVHCMDLPTYKRSGGEIGIKDFPGDLIRSFTEKGFVFHSRVCIWKDPLLAATRTKAIGLAHKQIVKDSAMCRHGIADYVLAFRKPGENPKPVAHPKGLTRYFGSRSVPNKFESYEDWEGEQKVNKRSHWIWQQYASPVWFDIRQTKVLPFRGAKDSDDGKHICPLQIDVIERCLVLWSAKDDVVLTPFMGVGSEVYCAVKAGRKGLGWELKNSYYKQAVLNLNSIAKTNKGFGIK